VSFSARIGARLLAEGIERRADLARLKALGVDLGQGYLLGKPAAEPLAPRRVDGHAHTSARVAVGRDRIAVDPARDGARLPSRA
jgi:EAL domain-containing protein (putative c-di-GMP-specific phosphodiesterase class I)